MLPTQGDNNLHTHTRKHVRSYSHGLADVGLVRKLVRSRPQAGGNTEQCSLHPLITDVQYTIVYFKSEIRPNVT
jgi:hypothetical protein